MYKEKYLKYKSKYLDLKSQLGGGPTQYGEVKELTEEYVKEVRNKL